MTRWPLARVGNMVAALAAGAVAACSGDEPPPEDPPVECWSSSPPHVDLGEAELGGGEEGSDTFHPLAPDQAVELIRGPQGGFHILVQPRVRGLSAADGGRIDTRFSALLEGETKVDPFECPHHPTYVADPAGGDYLLGRITPLIIVNERVPDVVDRPLLLRMEALDREGRYARDERRVIPWLAELPPDAGPAGDGGAADAAPADAGLAWATADPGSLHSRHSPYQVAQPDLRGEEARPVVSIDGSQPRR
jgi:hypothetical protein